MEIVEMKSNLVTVEMASDEALALVEVLRQGWDALDTNGADEFKQLWLWTATELLDQAGRAAQMVFHSQIPEGQRILQWVNEENLEELRHREDIREVLGEEYLDEYMRNMKAGKVKIERIDQVTEPADSE